MIGFIKKLFSGIISFLSGLIGDTKPQENKLPASSASKPSKPANNGNKRKRNGYFMELDETEEKQSANGNQSVKASVSDAAKNVAEVTKASVSDAAKTVKSAVADQSTATKSAKPAADKASATKTAKPATANKSDAKPEPIKTQSVSLPDKSLKVEMVQTDKGIKEEVKAEPAKSNKSNGQASAEKTFAPKYLMPSNSNSRRRPGPSMSNFLNMARQVKTPG